MEPQRTPLTGSCHCGLVRYIIRLTLPHVPSAQLPAPRGQQHIYRCNCTVCHKRGHFHVRPASPTDDFLILSPSSPLPSTATTATDTTTSDTTPSPDFDPLAHLADYTTGDKNLHFYTCPICFVHPFIFAGDLEPITISPSQLGIPGAEPGKVPAWRPTRGGGHPDMGHYVSVNGHTIDAGQGFDMRELTEEEKVMYCDCYSREEEESPMRYGRPQLHGSY